jgi:hypothetical protein
MVEPAVRTTVVAVLDADTPRAMPPSVLAMEIGGFVHAFAKVTVHDVTTPPPI